MESNVCTPINIGNPSQIKIIELAEIIRKKINTNVDIIFKPLPQDDPLKRKPIIEKAITHVYICMIISMYCMIIFTHTCMYV